MNGNGWPESTASGVRMGKTVSRKSAVELGLLVVLQAVVLADDHVGVGQLGPELVLPDAAELVLHVARGGQRQVELLARRPAVGRERADAGLELALEPADALAVELVEVVGRDGDEPDALQERRARVEGLEEDAPVKVDPAQLAVEVERGVGQVGVVGHRGRLDGDREILVDPVLDGHGRTARGPAGRCPWCGADGAVFFLAMQSGSSVRREARTCHRRGRSRPAQLHAAPLSGWRPAATSGCADPSGVVSRGAGGRRRPTGASLRAPAVWAERARRGVTLHGFAVFTLHPVGFTRAPFTLHPSPVHSMNSPRSIWRRSSLSR